MSNAKSNASQMEFGMEMTHYVGAIYSIPQMTGYLTRIGFNCQMMSTTYHEDNLSYL